MQTAEASSVSFQACENQRQTMTFLAITSPAPHSPPRGHPTPIHKHLLLKGSNFPNSCRKKKKSTYILLKNIVGGIDIINHTFKKTSVLCKHPSF